MMDCWTQRANVYIYIYFLVNSVAFEWCISFNVGPINTAKFENAPDLSMLFLHDYMETRHYSGSCRNLCTPSGREMGVRYLS